ncbi:type II toxin-antitoxin system VapC family toxin [Coleofasciculus sp. E1-EBD-02]|jgi:predicted nucleic acid-binding protein|uniref:type II toxin-antitoxin system VapC family toxin n=1 Tax=Coleofasciculus sp. E1-EBD-02 TaxID=3068481 RepID=UPI0032FE0A2B
MTATTRDLAHLPLGTRVFVDTIIFDLYFRSKSTTCAAFINRIAKREVYAYVNTQILSDLLHKLMLAEAVNKGYITRRSASKLKNKLSSNRSLASNLTDYQQQFEDILALGIKVLRISQKTLVETKRERTQYGLMTGDSLHLGTMNQHSTPIDNIVTHDSDFAHVPNLTIWTPMDVIP